MLATFISKTPKSAFSKQASGHMIATVLFAGTVMLSGCGIKGSLDTPPPLWGDENVETEQRDDDSILNESPLDDDQDDVFSDPLEQTEPL